MASQRVLSIARRKGVLLSFLFGFAFLGVLNAGVAQAGDVAWSEVHGKLGLDASEPEAAAREIPSLPAEGNARAAWLDVVVYVIVASMILVGYGLAARKVLWLRPRRLRRKP